MSFRGLAAAAVALSVASTACAGLLSLDELSQGSEGGAGGTVAGVGGTGAAVGGGGTGGSGLGGGGSSPCGPGELACDDRCIDVLENDENCGFCGHSCAGCEAGMCPSIELASAPTILGLTIDDSHVYWQPFEVGNRQLLRTPKQGGNAQVLEEGLGGVSDLRVIGSNLVFVRVGFGQLQRTAKDGSGAIIDLTLQSSGGVQSLRADDTQLWYLRSSSELRRSSSQGCCNETLVATIPMAQRFAIGGSWAFVHRTFDPLDVIDRVTLNGGEVQPFTDDLTDVAEQATQIEVDGTDVYWIVPDAIRRKAQQGATAPVQDVAATNVSPSTFALDAEPDGFVYFVDEISGTLMRVPKSGGQPVSLAVVPTGEASDLIADDTALYWIEGNATIRRLLKPAG